MGVSPEAKKHEQAAVQLENYRFRDIIQQEFHDTYRNLTYKSMMILHWASRNCRQARYLLKVDDDMFINMPGLIKFLDNKLSTDGYSPDAIFCTVFYSFQPVRDKGNVWYVSPELFNESVYPNYCSGTSYLIPMEMVAPIWEKMNISEVMMIEDVYVTGIIREKLNMTLINIAHNFCGSRLVSGFGPYSILGDAFEIQSINRVPVKYEKGDHKNQPYLDSYLVVAKVESFAELSVTFVNITGCLLYAEKVLLVLKNFSRVTLSNLSSHAGSDCSNYSGSFNLIYSPPFYMEKKILVKAIKQVQIRLTFKKTNYWWYVSEFYFHISTKPSTEEQKQIFVDRTVLINATHRRVHMEAPEKFAYACWQPMKIVITADDNDAARKMLYEVAFVKLEIQPFVGESKSGGFTHQVSDCVGFFTSGIWNFLVTTGTLLTILLFGVLLITSLKTMDRFDDPKGKPLVVNAKE
ncbi:unnamed protein product [Soboliphyme baturini]|uniref:Hexosyltransferase n=1 Tax=Soboliphyme baturini TaxID=241478 RepID=A0A183IMG7_9BILA|nr:unnamed protein product [Soboliphyme baturini]